MIRMRNSESVGYYYYSLLHTPPESVSGDLVS